jgi:hypothetical protein
MSSALKKAGKNLNVGTIAKNLDGGDISTSVKQGAKDAKVDIPLNSKNSGVEPPNTKPKDTGLEPPPKKSLTDQAKDLGKNVAVGGGVAGLAVFLPGLISQAGNTANTLGGAKIISDAVKEMFNALLDSPEGLTALVAVAGIVAYMSIRR